MILFAEADGWRPNLIKLAPIDYLKLVKESKVEMDYEWVQTDDRVRDFFVMPAFLELEGVEVRSDATRIPGSPMLCQGQFDRQLNN